MVGLPSKKDPERVEENVSEIVRAMSNMARKRIGALIVIERVTGLGDVLESGTRLDAQIVEGVSHIRRMGPSARLYLVTYTPDDPACQPYVSRLQHHLVEVCYVTPA